MTNVWESYLFRIAVSHHLFLSIHLLLYFGQKTVWCKIHILPLYMPLCRAHEFTHRRLTNHPNHNNRTNFNFSMACIIIIFKLLLTTLCTFIYICIIYNGIYRAIRTIMKYYIIWYAMGWCRCERGNVYYYKYRWVL